MKFIALLSGAAIVLASAPNRPPGFDAGRRAAAGNAPLITRRPRGQAQNHLPIPQASSSSLNNGEPAVTLPMGSAPLPLPLPTGAAPLPPMPTGPAPLPTGFALPNPLEFQPQVPAQRGVMRLPRARSPDAAAYHEGIPEHLRGFQGQSQASSSSSSNNGHNVVLPDPTGNGQRVTLPDPTQQLPPVNRRPPNFRLPRRFDNDE
ncbi:hypothetical protein ROZALSC1DRAFT_30651 [Rozella allomycis CSF55]|uniref:Uncharacterized protein n=1 Tax=Rozella allomycis (strain CSF55) TaxID=988480 RepID=A0A075B4Z9_ROZAC|nr:hypothetical protein O9G_006124 [Rozella allomycis CSF55]RKP17557.1 hypothetical protein ROZALSC1DRAFT_30651 [Rozella allomycis CSF55]|eukprot:EPZ36806.1 hypothetical protein O9G_006124 [Rozella allomycis CSF55]